jgi:transglutaminase/protease-like cytokinesis protein 3
MSIQELEAQLLRLDMGDRQRIVQVLLQSLTPPQNTSPNESSIVDFFRNSPLCEVADELDLTRDQRPIPDRISL